MNFVTAAQNFLLRRARKARIMRLETRKRAEAPVMRKWTEPEFERDEEKAAAKSG